MHESKKIGSTANKTPIREQAALDIGENRSKARNPISHLPLVAGILNLPPSKQHMLPIQDKHQVSAHAFP